MCTHVGLDAHLYSGTEATEGDLEPEEAALPTLAYFLRGLAEDPAISTLAGKTAWSCATGAAASGRGRVRWDADERRLCGLVLIFWGLIRVDAYSLHFSRVLVRFHLSSLCGQRSVTS